MIVIKKIFIMAHSLDIGGAESSLLGILENIDKKNYQVDLFLLRHTGELMQYLPKEINLLPPNNKYSSLGIPITEVLKKGQLSIALGRYQGKRKATKRIKELHIQSDNNVVNEYSHKYTVKYLPMMSDKVYDLAISFMSPHYFVTEKVKAKKKVAWIHTDYSTYSVDVDSEMQMWDKYDNIISISDDVSKSFIKTFPLLKSKICLIENIMPMSYMKAKMNEFSVEDEMPNGDYTKILSIGRFSPQKNFTSVPKICKAIYDMGLNIKWYLIGYGGEEELIRKKIDDYNMQDNVIILGKKDNPYPYIKACDIYAQPSLYEGKSIAVREAQILAKPVVITNYSTANSQLEDGFDGIIVPMDTQLCAEGIAGLVNDKTLQIKLSNNTKSKDYILSNEIKKLYDLMEN